MAPVTRGVIRAAGGLVFRDAPGGVEVCLVHRPRYDDWSLPKGKLSPGEHPLAAAVREVAEETGLRAAPLHPLPRAHYEFQGAPKVVDYWAMRVLAEEPFVAGSEVDGVRWVSLSTALDLLSYQRDVIVTRAFAALPPLTGVAALIRHASAGERGEFTGPDQARPLDGTGIGQAAALADLLALLDPAVLVAAPPRRCVSTLAPLAARMDLPIEVDAAFAEDADPAAAADRLRQLVPAQPGVVVCTQRGLLPHLMAALDDAGAGGPDYTTPKAGGWLLPFSGTTTLTALRLSLDD